MLERIFEEVVKNGGKLASGNIGAKSLWARFKFENEGQLSKAQDAAFKEVDAINAKLRATKHRLINGVVTTEGNTQLYVSINGVVKRESKVISEYLKTVERVQ